MRFEQLSRAEQRYEVDSAIPAILATLTRPTPTVIVVARVARALDADLAYVTGLVIAAAREHPQARQDGETFKRYGKTMRRWVWYPSAGQPVAAPIRPESIGRTLIEPDWDGDDPRWPAWYAEAARRDAAAMVDTSDW